MRRDRENKRRLSRRAALRAAGGMALVGAVTIVGFDPQSISAAPRREQLRSGRIFAADSFGDAVSVYEVTGGNKLSFATVNGGGFIGPMAVSPDGRLFAVTNASNGSLFDITAGGDLTGAPALAGNLFPSGLKYVEGLAFDSGGNAYVSSGENGAQPIVRIDPSGAVSYLPTVPSNPTGLLVKSGVLYVSEGDSGSVLAMTLPGGQTTPFASGFRKSSSRFSGQLAVDPRGHLLLLWSTIVDSGLYDISAGGSFAGKPPLAKASFSIDLNQIAVDSANNVYAAGNGDGVLAVSRFSGSFAPFVTFVSGLGDTESVAITP